MVQDAHPETRMTWDAQQYLRFAQPRLRPALDLMSRVSLTDPQQVCDLGCGAGNVTACLMQRWPRAQVIGVDSSAEMLARARVDWPQIEWQQVDLAQWQPDRRFDLIFSNAALHWLSEHARLLPQLMQHLNPGGVLAVQMPDNFHAPSHTAMADTVHVGPWREALLPLLGLSPVADAADYFRLLQPLAVELDIWQTVYLQVLSGPDAVKEWTKATWLRRFLDALSPAQATAFEADYATRVRLAYPPLPDGRTLFPFRRLFIVARTAGG
jgi:trans-aconitate 2-methyltransferase